MSIRVAISIVIALLLTAFAVGILVFKTSTQHSGSGHGTHQDLEHSGGGK